MRSRINKYKMLDFSAFTFFSIAFIGLVFSNLYLLGLLFGVFEPSESVFLGVDSPLLILYGVFTIFFIMYLWFKNLRDAFGVKMSPTKIDIREE